LRWALRLDKQELRQPTTQSESLLETVGDYHAQKSPSDSFESITGGYLASMPDLRKPYSRQNHLLTRQKDAGTRQKPVGNSFMHNPG
jgi:hypothetical protein